MGRVCEMCPESSPRSATLFCAADASYLCDECDQVVHSANILASRHERRPFNDPEADGSSINDESEIDLVPDVDYLGMHIIEDQPRHTSRDTLLSLPSNVPSFEDAAEYNLSDFDTLGAKMPALCAIDDDGLWAGGKLGRSFYSSDISWESVVNDGFEHVVPEMHSMERENGKLAKSMKAEPRISVHVSEKGDDVMVEGGYETSEQSDKGEKREKKEQMEVSTDDGRDEEEIKMLEMRKKRRMEALARFRSKRANRTFTKKVRYECRKQLADSRPRVKGRFVRKIEMALFRKYGALYRNHLDELKGDDQLVPTL